MNIKFGKILLACLFFAVASAHGNTGRPGSFMRSSGNVNNASAYSHSAIEGNNELELSVIHSLCSSSQQVSAKKITGFDSIESAKACTLSQNNLFSFNTATTDKHSFHLLLIFPFHYFW
ncbi:MAG: hypothetical protein V4539_06105 [Bacteroidota bacterium]